MEEIASLIREGREIRLPVKSDILEAIHRYQRAINILKAALEGLSPGKELRELGLDARTLKALNRAGISDIDQLTETTEGQLLQIKNFGMRCLRRVEEALATRGLRLKPGPREPLR